MEILKLLPLEELRNYVTTQIYLHMQRFAAQPSTAPTTADVVQHVALAINTGPSDLPATPTDLPHTPVGSVASKSIFFHNQLLNVIGKFKI